MKRWCFIWIVFITELAVGQESCRPEYNLPVQYLSVEGINIAYVERGKGQPVIFIHGLGGNLSHWTKNIKDLSKKYRCIAIDLPGYGYSDKEFDTNGNDHLAFYAKLLAAFIKKKKLKKTVLAGHSMGGQIAMITSLGNPRLISKLLLIAPAGLESFSAAESELLTNATQPLIFQQQDSAMIRNSYQLNFFSMPADAMKLINERIRLKACPDFIQYTEAVSLGVKGMLAHPVKDKIKNIKQPVLLLFGENDALIPNRYLHPTLKLNDLVNEFSRLLPGAKTIMISSAGHLVQYEKPIETNKAIKNFLQ